MRLNRHDQVKSTIRGGRDPRGGHRTGLPGLLLIAALGLSLLLSACADLKIPPPNSATNSIERDPVLLSL